MTEHTERVLFFLYNARPPGVDVNARQGQARQRLALLTVPGPASSFFFAPVTRCFLATWLKASLPKGQKPKSTHQSQKAPTKANPSDRKVRRARSHATGYRARARTASAQHAHNRPLSLTTSERKPPAGHALLFHRMRARRSLLSCALRANVHRCPLRRPTIKRAPSRSQIC